VPRTRQVTRFIAAVAIISAGLVAPAGAARRASAPLPTFTFLADHPWAEAQPTATGRQIVDLQEHDGRIYAGYGDYSANTGPITIASIGAGETAFEAEAVSDTEAIYNYRPLNGKLFAPATDPRFSADYASDGPWADTTGIGAWHAFDMATLTGTDLWIVGSQGNDAVAWRSLDGGTTWTEALRVNPQPGGGYSRFYFAGVLGGKLYVQAHDANLGAHPTSMVFNGGAWAAGPALIEGSEPGWRPVEFNGSLVFATWGQGYASTIKVFNGRRTTAVGLGYDVTVDGNSVFILDNNGTLQKTNDLRKFVPVAQAPASARSVEVSGTSAYVGTASGELLVTATSV
jgi:hypothetical protein